MSFGARIWGADGALQIDENSFTYRVVLSTLVTFGVAVGKTNQDFAVPGCTAANSMALIIPNGTYTTGDLQFETEMLSGVARVYNYTRTFAASTIASGTQRLIVMRFS